MLCWTTRASPNGSATRCPPRAGSTTASRWRPCSPRWRWPPNRPIPTRRAGRCSWFAPRWCRWRSGLVLGGVGGLVIARSRRRGWMSDDLGAVGDARSRVGVLPGGRGAARQRFRRRVRRRAGVRVRRQRAEFAPDTQVSDAAGQLLELMVFAMFGGYAVIVGWRDARLAGGGVRGHGAVRRAARRGVTSR